MPVTVKLPTNVEQYFTDDGRLTQPGMLLFQQWVRAIKDHEDRIVVLEP